MVKIMLMMLHKYSYKHRVTDTLHYTVARNSFNNSILSLPLPPYHVAASMDVA